MASHDKPVDEKRDTKKKAEDDSKHEVSKEKEASKGELRELLEQVEEMYKTFLVVSPEVVSNDSESGKSQPWRSRRLELEKGKEKSGGSESGEASPWPPRQQQGARSKMPYSPRKFQPRFDLPDFQPEWQEIDDLVKCIRKILHNPMYEGGARLSPEDEVKVRGLLEYHLKAEEKKGPGIDYIKIDHIHEDTRCFWVVRVDGTEIDFSYHKCLKAKVAKEFPDLLEHYESLYQKKRQG